ncbi:hypothetical protein UB32_07595 [Mesobacillus subterraneus]|uniref:Uncharacterized protein n=1 Tax=Mesobacillus subterraneus TaxID=285983 RepID=A0A0D6Z9W4_9BACI|nr:hypothetical protein UB32_07595 [Mesobacillus subterraneus]
MAEFTILLAIFRFYWRKYIFIGDFPYFIGENKILLANWKLSSFFSSKKNRSMQNRRFDRHAI